MSTGTDVTQLVQRIRAEIDQRSEKLIMPMSSPASRGATAGVSSEIISGLTSLHSELDALRGEIQNGEPLPRSPTLSNRLGGVIKRRLYRFLWWQSSHINTLVNLMLRHSSEELKLAVAISDLMGRVRQAEDLVLESTRKLQECENRLQQLETAHLKLQAAQIKQNVERATERENNLDSLRKHVSETKQLIDGHVSETKQLIDGHVSETKQLIDGHVSETKQLIDGAETRMMQLLEGNNARSSQHIHELMQRVNLDAAQRAELGARLSDLGMFTHQTRTALTMQDRRLSLFIEEARKRLPDPLNAAQLQTIVANHDKHKFDSIYGAFEDVFRGSREEIKARQAAYLPFLKQRAIGTSTMPILDLGCGRGEWLQLLTEHGLEARGIDLNESMVEQCNALNLTVEKGEALSYLRGLPDSSIGALTSFHMVEHLPFEVVLTLIDEALRVLKPDGILILETPNPQNLMVGAHTFYLDPTHLKPLPSPMLRFFVEARGFCEVHVWELQPYPESMRFPDGEGLVAKRLNHYLYGPQDYSVVGRKP